MPNPVTLALSLLAMITSAVTGGADAQGPTFSIVSAVRDHRELAGAHDVELQGDHAFIAGKWGAFAVVDISRPSHPRVLGSITEGIGDGETVLPLGDVCLVGADALLAVDVADPTRPALLKRVVHPTIRRINGMVRRGAHVLAASKGGDVNVFDIARPRDPRFIGSLDTRKCGSVTAPHDIAVFGNHAIVVDQRRGSPVKLCIYRIGEHGRDTLWPVDRWVVEGAVKDKRLDGANRIAIRPPHAFVACNHADNVAVVCLENPRRPVVLAVIPTADHSPCGLTRHGDTLFVASERTVEAVSIEDPHRPRSLCHLTAPDVFAGGDPRASDPRRRRGGAHDLVFRAGLLYVTAQGSDGLGVFRFHGRPGRSADGERPLKCLDDHPKKRPDDVPTLMAEGNPPYPMQAVAAEDWAEGQVETGKRVRASCSTRDRRPLKAHAHLPAAHRCLHGNRRLLGLLRRGGTSTGRLRKTSRCCPRAQRLPLRTSRLAEDRKGKGWNARPGLHRGTQAHGRRVPRRFDFQRQGQDV